MTPYLVTTELAAGQGRRTTVTAEVSAATRAGALSAAMAKLTRSEKRRVRSAQVSQIETAAR